MNIDRRNFLKTCAGICALELTNTCMPSAKIFVNQAVEKATGHPTGNAQITKRQRMDCPPNEATNCPTLELSKDEKILAIAISPPLEETMFRVFPSLTISAIDDNRKNPIKDVLWGTGGLGMTRREILVGIGSSLSFGLLHNITTRGIDTNTIPASQTLGGMIYWILQRKFGIFASNIAHIRNNYNAITQ